MKNGKKTANSGTGAKKGGGRGAQGAQGSSQTQRKHKTDKISKITELLESIKQLEDDDDEKDDGKKKEQANNIRVSKIGEEAFVDVKIVANSRHLLPCLIKGNKKGKANRELIHPDTGASKSVIGEAMVRRMGLLHLVEENNKY